MQYVTNSSSILIGTSVHIPRPSQPPTQFTRFHSLATAPARRARADRPPLATRSQCGRYDSGDRQATTFYAVGRLQNCTAVSERCVATRSGRRFAHAHAHRFLFLNCVVVIVHHVCTVLTVLYCTYVQTTVQVSFLYNTVQCVLHDHFHRRATTLSHPCNLLHRIPQLYLFFTRILPPQNLSEKAPLLPSHR